MNPIRALAKVLGEMHDANGKVRIPGFYDGIRKPSRQAARSSGRASTSPPTSILGDVGLSQPAGEKRYSVLEQLWARPTVEFNGITGGYQGVGTKTVIPSQASVKITCRLVPGQDPDKVLKGLERFVKERLPKDCRAEFMSRARLGGHRLRPQGAIRRTRRRRHCRRNGAGPPRSIGMGGSIPIVTSFKDALGMDSLLVGFGLDDDRIHSPNEKYNLSSFRKGARSWARILRWPGGVICR